MLVVLFIALLQLSNAARVTINPRKAVSRVSERYVSFTIDASEIFYFELGNTKIQYLAKELSPAVLRVGGTQADYTYYKIGKETCSHLPAGRYKCLEMSTVDAMVSFAKSANLSLVYGLSLGYPTYAPSKWDPSNSHDLLAYMKSKKYPIYGLELGNEVNKDVTASFQANAFKLLSNISSSIFGSAKPRLLGPDPHSYIQREPESQFKWVEDFMADSCGVVSAFTYHSYVNQNATQILSVPGLDEQKKESTRIVDAMKQHCPGTPIWAGEIAEHNQGGISGVTNTFLDSFWYADALGSLAVLGHEIFARQILDKGRASGAAAGYPMIAYETPLPDYWVAYFHKKLFGTTVLDATSNDSYVRVYSHCGLKNHVGVLVISISSFTKTVDFTGVSTTTRLDYVLTATSLSSQSAQLNGKTLKLTSDGKIPQISPVTTNGNTFNAPPHSISFVMFPNEKC